MDAGAVNALEVVRFDTNLTHDGFWDAGEAHGLTLGCSMKVWIDVSGDDQRDVDEFTVDIFPVKESTPFHKILSVVGG